MPRIYQGSRSRIVSIETETNSSKTIKHLTLKTAKDNQTICWLVLVTAVILPLVKAARNPQPEMVPHEKTNLKRDVMS